MNTLLTGVHIVKPQTTNGSYTLASGNSPLPITVQNDLRTTVQIEVHVSTVNGLTGFTQLDDDKVFTIDPTSKAPLRIAEPGRAAGPDPGPGAAVDADRRSRSAAPSRSPCTAPRSV